MKQADIHATLAVGSTATAPYYDINIIQQLCTSACCDEIPVFSPQFSVQTIENVGTNQYLVTIHIEGTISFVPCNCGCCQTRSQVLSQNFNVPVYSTDTPTITLSAGSTSNRMVRGACCSCSNTFQSDTPLTINIA